MDYAETCAYLFSQLPMYEQQGKQGYKEGLVNTLLLDEHFGHPHHAYRTIHVAGTNGKGSCSHTLAAILQQLGYKVGLYTSPHLADFRERIRVNGIPISEDYVIDFVETERPFFEPLCPTFFELTTAMAFKYFKEMEVDWAVIEVGLGGRLDCTNIITPTLSVITNISFDHTQFLGDTLAKIAAEKAGIIKQGVPVVIGETTEETRPVFEAKAAEMSAPITFAEDDTEVISATPTNEGGMMYDTTHLGHCHGDLGGIYQSRNLNTVLHALNILIQKGICCRGKQIQDVVEIHHEVTEAIQNVCRLTGLAGRWQQLKSKPRVVCDTGHNVGGWKYISRQLHQTSCRQMHIVFGMVDDKDLDGVLSLLPQNATYYFTKANNKRAVSETTIQASAHCHGLRGNAYPSVYEAYMAAEAQAADDDFIFIGGSNYIVGELLKISI